MTGRLNLLAADLKVDVETLLLYGELGRLGMILWSHFTGL